MGTQKIPLMECNPQVQELQDQRIALFTHIVYISLRWEDVQMDMEENQVG